MPFRPPIRFSLGLGILFFFSSVLFAVSLEGDISVGGSYNTNAGLLSSEELATLGRSTRSNRAFGVDLDALLDVALNDLATIEYSLFTTITPTDTSLSFWYHSLTFSFSHELDDVDIEYGIETGHLLVGFENRTVDPQLFFNLFWYTDPALSYYLSASFAYTVGLASLYDYFTAPGGRFETGIYLYPVAENPSCISLGAGERLFFFGEEFLAPFVPQEPTVWSQHGFSETYVRLKGKIFFRDFSAEILGRYGVSYYLADDRWTLARETYIKRRIDHNLRLGTTLEYRFTDVFSILGYYQYQRAFSSIGAESSDYTDLSYDQHLAGVMFRFVF